ncbi:MAG TPA: GNAT family N-acetyltransferase [Burkholderiaceae bacterium]|nr:GNAT family N-acetyltransferase [Burkholderiaceae bacterium]
MIDWKWARFEALERDDVYDALALRARIFVVEQDCAYLDADGLDRQAWHLLGRDAQGVLQAYLRVVDPGLKFDVPSIGRVIVDPARRGTRLGHQLLIEGLRRCEQAWPRQPNRIGAQARLQRFYAQHGYVAVGDVYLEDDIEHIDMERAAR